MSEIQNEIMPTVEEVVNKFVADDFGKLLINQSNVDLIPLLIAAGRNVEQQLIELYDQHKALMSLLDDKKNEEKERAKHLAVTAAIELYKNKNNLDTEILMNTAHAIYGFLNSDQ